MQTKHYICLGGCQGVSKVSGVCQAVDCKNHSHSLVPCNCKDEKHNDFKQKFWFKRKLYGYGWYPSSWQGWLSVLFYIFVVLILSMQAESFYSTEELMMGFIIPLILSTVILIFISYKKGEKPRWQWGKDKGDE